MSSLDFCNIRLKFSFPQQQISGNEGQDSGNQDCVNPTAFHGQRIGIDAEEREDNIRNLDDNGNDRQAPHDGVLVIGDDVGKRVHHSGDNAAVDRSHLDRLPELDADVVHEVLVFGIEFERSAALNLLDCHEIRLEGGCEVNEGLFQPHKLNDLLRFHRAAETLLHGVGDFVDLFEIKDEAGGNLHEDLEDEARPELGLDIRNFPVSHCAEHLIPAQ